MPRIRAQKISRSTTFESAIDAILYPRRMAAGILSFAGVIGLALAAIGLYGVVSYSVAQRLREIGIRATLGARPRDLVRLILSEGVGVAAIGSVLGLGLGYGALGVASKIVPGMPALNAAALIAVPVVIVGVILAACYLPARRAGRVDPMVESGDSDEPTAPPSAPRFAHFVLPIDHGLAVRDPGRGGLALQVVPEPLQDALLVVLLVAALREAVILVGVFDHHDVLPGAAAEAVELEPLVPPDRAIHRTDFDRASAPSCSAR